jgi:hypothetical protein
MRCGIEAISPVSDGPQAGDGEDQRADQSAEHPSEHDPVAQPPRLLWAVPRRRPL